MRGRTKPCFAKFVISETKVGERPKPDLVTYDLSCPMLIKERERSAAPNGTKRHFSAPNGTGFLIL
jgi:hypothetical protein